jgi:uncharacterized membrane protein YfcA
MESIFFYITLFFISTIQSIAGVGILVLGTPIMIFLNYSIIDSMLILLPISMISSFKNLIIIKFFCKNDTELDFKLFKYFFIFCFPSICVGLLIIKYYSNLINFNILVSFIIFLSIFIRIKFENFSILKKKFKKIFTLTTGLIHGLTNSGGTILTLFLLNEKNKSTITSRFEIHLFYFLLAFTQFLFLISITEVKQAYEVSMLTVTFIILISAIIGNFFFNKVTKITQIVAYILAVFAGMMLLFKDLII